jgi:hypothetical protein
MDLKFYKEALLRGMTGNAFKLGTVLTGGWFWVRIRGCMMLYCGDDLSTIDFDHILAIESADAEQINVSVAGGPEHCAGDSYLYVVRRANNCGMMEYDLQGLVFVRFDSEGRLGRPRPNGVFGLQARQVASEKAELGWYYCPLGQRAEPACFVIYISDVRIGTVEFKGKGFYSFAIEQLDEGRSCFAVKAEDRTDVSGPPAVCCLELNCAVPPKARIISAEAL